MLWSSTDGIPQKEGRGGSRVIDRIFSFTILSLILLVSTILHTGVFATLFFFFFFWRASKLFIKGKQIAPRVAGRGKKSPLSLLSYGGFLFL